jgi:hypothetical protein
VLALQAEARAYLVLLGPSQVAGVVLAVGRAPLARHQAPDEGMAMLVPIGRRLSHAWQTCSHVAKRRPLSASARKTFHHSSIKLR